MAKKGKSKQGKDRPKTLTANGQEESNPLRGSEPAADNDNFDFGGLPNRDLKKNLGCG
jgi:hypothetical protein